MSVTVRLLGTPTVEVDGVVAAAPRGTKAWALLGYLVSSRHPVGRRLLAELLFGEADDPMGALRWTLAELRRALRAPDALRGDPLPTSVAGVAIDLSAIIDGDDASLLAAAGTFLDGIHVDGCPAFESWLVVERYRWSSEQEARLRAAAKAALADGEPARAVELAARAVACNVLDETNHELVVRSLMTLGDRAGAARQVAVCEDVFRRELGRSPTATLRAALDDPVPHPVAAPVSRADAESLLDMGEAAVAAGATHRGVDALYEAVAHAATSGDRHLHARAVLALGTALVHAVRGRDGEGSTLLHQALHLATETGDRRIAMHACRELGFVDVQAGRRGIAGRWLTRAASLADDDGARGTIAGIQGMNAADGGLHDDAVDLFDRSVGFATSAGDTRQQAWSLGVQARSFLLRGDESAAVHATDRAIALCRAQRWMAFLPWPRALRAELHLTAGRADLALEEIEPAWSLSCRLGDPCWEGMTARMLGRLRADAGDGAGAAMWFEEGLRRCDAAADTYRWVRGYLLDAWADSAQRFGDTVSAARRTDEMEELAARAEMHELVVRAQLHRARLGHAESASAARLLVTDVQNPALHRAVHALGG